MKIYFTPSELIALVEYFRGREGFHSHPPNTPPPAPPVHEVHPHVSEAGGHEQHGGPTLIRPSGAALAAFRDLCLIWRENFEVADVPQPPRVEALRQFAQGPYFMEIYQYAFALGSLQAVINEVLWPEKVTYRGDWIDHVDRLSGNMVQVSCTSCPELAGAHDYSTSWKRKLQ